MKKILIALLLACISTTASLAQGQRVKNRIIDKDYYPVDHATVTVKGTGIRTTTDKEGNFVLENVPLILDSIGVQKGKKVYSATTPLCIRMKRELADRFSWYVKLGGGYPFLDMEAGSSMGASCYEIYGGVGVDIRLSRHWSFQPGIGLTYRRMVGDDYDYYYDNSTGYSYASEGQIYETGVLEVPLLFALRFPLSSLLNLVVRMGGYMDLGLWGTLDREWETSVPPSPLGEQIDVFKKHRFCGGGAYGLGLEMGRHFMLGFLGHTGWSSYDYTTSFTSIAFEVGYRF